MASSGRSPKRKRKSDKAAASSSSSSSSSLSSSSPSSSSSSSSSSTSTAAIIDKQQSSSPPAGDGRGAAPAAQATATTMTIRVEVAPEDPENDPVVVSFPRGVPASIAGRTGDGAGVDGDGDGPSPPPRFERSRLRPSSSSRGGGGTVVRGGDDRCSYSARAYGRGHDGRLTKAYVCVFDRGGGTLRLVPSAERGTIFALEQKVAAWERNAGGTAAAARVGAAAGPISASDQMQLLVDSFGSRKKQKVMNSRASNRVDVGNALGSGDTLMRSVAEQQGISRENRRAMLEEGDEKVRFVSVLSVSRTFPGVWSAAHVSYFWKHDQPLPFYQIVRMLH
jgi:hypothetical protein